MDANHLAFPKTSFDVVVAVFVVHLVDNAALVVAEVLRVLAPGGLVAIAIPGGEPQTELAEPDPVPGLYGEFAQYLPPDGSMGMELDVADLLARAGVVDVADNTEVCPDVHDAHTSWDG